MIMYVMYRDGIHLKPDGDVEGVKTVNIRALWVDTFANNIFNNIKQYFFCPKNIYIHMAGKILAPEL